MDKTIPRAPRYSRKGLATVTQYSIWDFDRHLEQYPLAKYLHLKAPEYYSPQPCKCWNEALLSHHNSNSINWLEFDA